MQLLRFILLVYFRQKPSQLLAEAFPTTTTVPLPDRLQ
jgi:hypothetical protein